MPDVTEWRGPWWAELIKTLGPTTVIALGLVYWLTQSLSPVLDKMTLFMIQHSQDTERQEAARVVGQIGMLGKIQALTQQMQTDRDILMGLQFQTCINTAKSSYQTSKCEALLQSHNKKENDSND